MGVVTGIRVVSGIRIISRLGVISRFAPGRRFHRHDERFAGQAVRDGDLQLVVFFLIGQRVLFLSDHNGGAVLFDERHFSDKALDKRGCDLGIRRNRFRRHVRFQRAERRRFFFDLIDDVLYGILAASGGKDQDEQQYDGKKNDLQCNSLSLHKNSPFLFIYYYNRCTKTTGDASCSRQGKIQNLINHFISVDIFITHVIYLYMKNIYCNNR